MCPTFRCRDARLRTNLHLVVKNVNNDDKNVNNDDNEVSDMEWTPEAVKALMDYRLEDARRYAVARELRAGQPSWWRRLRTQHPQHPTDTRRHAA